MLESKKIGIIGGGFAGLSTACYLAKEGFDVYVFEKNETIGGRARVFETEGFKFDMGPSWYWMPDVFENFFNDFDKKVSDYYQLEKLSPGFQVVFENQETIAIDKDFEDIKKTFENIEKGAGNKLQKFIDRAEHKYQISMTDLVYKPCHNVLEFFRWDIIKETLQNSLFSPLSKEVDKLFNNTKLKQIVEFPVIFLGAMADKIPSLYSIMNYAAMKQGTFYPQGGMGKIVEGMQSLAGDLGVNFYTKSIVQKIQVENNKASGIVVNGRLQNFDLIVSAADYHHTESKLLEDSYRNYNESYWDSRVFAPSSILFYLGLNKKLPKLIHHTLFFDTDFKKHADNIYEKPSWTQDPLFYVCCPSKTDNTVAPEGSENLFILIPYSTKLTETDEIIEQNFDNVISRLEKYCGETIKDSIVFRRNFSGKDFKSEYNSYDGNAYGLANTLMQTAFLKPKIRNKKLKNLYYTGQLTVPGPGVPPAIISGKIVAKEIIKNFRL